MSKQKTLPASAAVAAAGALPTLLLSLAALVVLLPPPVSGQGLIIGQDQLGAGEAAVVTQFERFEEILDLSSQSTGGRGRGRGGTTSTTGGTGFRSVKSLQQLQLAMYYLAGSPPVYNSWNTSQNPGGISLLPGVRDQLDCDSCVAQAIAAAIQASAAAAWRKNADQKQFNISAASLYYCSEGGKTCKTGWDLQEALAMIMDKSQFLIRPTACARILHNPVNEPQVFDWKPACQQAEQACNSQSSRAMPWLSCNYKSLSSFVEIQRHIRQHGGVLTRITVYDDFFKHFNVTTDSGESRATVDGAKHKAYNRTADSKSKPLFGHAALIVGYNNTELTWTLLNSYGKQRFTRDGLFKIAMGVAGVAVPDQTFGVDCRPTPGGPDDLHYTDWLTPWISDPALRPRKPVEYWDRAKDLNNLNTRCYKYRIAAQDSVSSIADAFDVGLQQLVRANQALFTVQQVNYTLRTGTQLADLQKVATVANQVQLTNGSKPFFACRIYTGQTWFSSRTCKQDDLGPCAGAWACKIVYSEADVSAPLELGTAVKVCGIAKVFDRVAFFKDPRDSQPRALELLLQVGVPNALYPIQGKSDQQDCYVGRSPLVTVEAFCGNADGVVTLIYIKQAGPVRPFVLQDMRAVHALFSLQQLSKLVVFISGGTFPPQLGALKKLERLYIYNYCTYPPSEWGPLPGNWLRGGWRETLTHLEIKGVDGNNYDAYGLCGIKGTLPAIWFEPSAPAAALVELDLSMNQLTGSLPEALPMAMPSLNVIDLSHNSLVGPIPTSFAKFQVLEWLDLENNKLSSWVPLGLNIRSLHLANNPGLKGCVPYGDATFENTGIDLSIPSAEKYWKQQLQALDLLLPSELVGSPITDRLGLPKTVVAFFAEHLDAASTPEQNYRYTSSTGEIFKGELIVSVGVVSGMPCIFVLYLTFDSSGPLPIDMQQLPEVLQALVCLGAFALENSGRASKPAASDYARYQLPADLPRAVPRLVTLQLQSCGLVGTIPDDWRNWDSLKNLELGGNFLDGTLPAWKGTINLTRLDLSGNTFSGAALPAWRGMTGLQSLNLADCGLSGSLPASWAESLPPNIVWLDLRYNPGITGPIPVAWWQPFAITPYVKLTGTSLTGCKPPDWGPGTMWPAALVDAPLCGQSEVHSLLRVKQLLQSAIPSLPPLLSSWIQDGTEATNGGTGFTHCRTWQGVDCNSGGQVIGVDLSSLQGAVTRPLNLTALLQPLATLAQLQTLKLQDNPQLFIGSTIPSTLTWHELQHLDVSNCGLTGSLPNALGDLPSLAHLNTSHNPGISGPLPERLAATPLAVLDVFACGVSGQLPVSLAVLPLQVLRAGAAVRPASADTSISGPLPPEYGIINTFRELSIVNTWISGSIPTAWFDSAASSSAAAAAAAATAAATASADQDAAAGRIAAAWQRVTNRLSSSSSSEAAAAAAATAPAGNGLSMQQLEVLVLASNTDLGGAASRQARCTAAIEGAAPFQQQDGGAAACLLRPPQPAAGVGPVRQPSQGSFQHSGLGCAAWQSWTCLATHRLVVCCQHHFMIWLVPSAASGACGCKTLVLEASGTRLPVGWKPSRPDSRASLAVRSRWQSAATPESADERMHE